MRRTFLLSLLLLLSLCPARAQTVWEMPTEYPATAIVGEGVAYFAAEVGKRIPDKLVIRPAYASSTKSAAMVEAVTSGKVQAADAFGGAMSGEGAAFQLSSLPFLATSVEDAQRLARLARPVYEKALAAKGLKLLYITGWPPSGVWSKTALSSAADLKGLSIRTYDATSTRVLDAVGAKAQNISFADVMPKLADGSVTAVLSSGDGGAGRQLWKFLPHFSAVSYAFPLSFAFVKASAFEALPTDQRSAVEFAARETEARQWQTLAGRLEKNYATMRANGVMIVVTPPGDVAAALRAAAVSVVDAWAQGAGDEGRAVLAGFRK